MTILSLVVILIAIGVALYLIGLIPMDPKILTIIRVVVVFAVVLWVLDIFVDLGEVGRIHRRH